MSHTHHLRILIVFCSVPDMRRVPFFKWSIFIYVFVNSDVVPTTVPKTQYLKNINNSSYLATDLIIHNMKY
jgi:hypothetical protein